MTRERDGMRVAPASRARWGWLILLAGAGCGLAALLGLVSAQQQDFDRQVDTIIMQTVGAHAVEQTPTLRAAVAALQACRTRLRLDRLPLPACWQTVAVAVDARNDPALAAAFAQLQREVERAVAALAVPWPLQWWRGRRLS